MKEIPMSVRDEMKQLKSNTSLFIGIKRKDRLPLPEGNEVRKYLFDNFRPKGIGYNDLTFGGVRRIGQTHPTFPKNVIPSEVHDGNLLIRAIAEKYDAACYIYIPKENIDDLDPRCSISVVTSWGSFYREDAFFLQTMGDFRGWALDNLEKAIKDIKK